jgi:glutathione synthase/RimK-type ligase-like ATP-grasp enzyme
VIYTVAIQPDDYGSRDAYSPMWIRLLQAAGHKVRLVDVYRADILDQVRGCHGFMWRHGGRSNMRQIARRILPVFEKELGLVVYPDQNTCWHYDDKIAQRYLLDAAKIPIPNTWVWYERDSAKEWAGTAEYPLVIKLWSGCVSQNVGLVASYKEAELWIDKLFERGVHKLSDKFLTHWPFGKRRVVGAVKLLFQGSVPNTKLYENAWELHKNYILFQEFLPQNPFDIRIVVIGNRAFGFRRFNRPNDFRASGSGNADIDPKHVPLETVRLGFKLADHLKTQSIAIDCLRKDKEWVVVEMSYTFPHFITHDCPGHWELQGEPDTGELIWHDGQMWPEEAQIIDFLDRLNAGQS